MPLQSDQEQMLRSLRTQLAVLAQSQPYLGQTMNVSQLYVLYTSTREALGLLCSFAESLSAPEPASDMLCSNCGVAMKDYALILGVKVHLCYACRELIWKESQSNPFNPAPPVLACASCDRPDVEKKLLYGLPLRICHTCLEEVVTAVHTSVARTARDRLEWALDHDYPRGVKRADDTK